MEPTTPEPTPAGAGPRLSHTPSFSLGPSDFEGLQEMAGESLNNFLGSAQNIFNTMDPSDRKKWEEWRDRSDSSVAADSPLPTRAGGTAEGKEDATESAEAKSAAKEAALAKCKAMVEFEKLLDDPGWIELNDKRTGKRTALHLATGKTVTEPDA